MYTVVIIDDEPWALQGLAEIIDWSRDGFSICPLPAKIDRKKVKKTE